MWYGKLQLVGNSIAVTLIRFLPATYLHLGGGGLAQRQWM